MPRQFLLQLSNECVCKGWDGEGWDGEGWDGEGWDGEGWIVRVKLPWGK